MHITGAFTSAKAVTATVQVSGLALPHVYVGGSEAEGPHTCEAAPATFQMREVHPGPALPPP